MCLGRLKGYFPTPARWSCGTWIVMGSAVVDQDSATKVEGDPRRSVVWDMPLAAGSTGTRMTYLHQGRPYIVIAIGGLTHPAEVIALSLP